MSSQHAAADRPPELSPAKRKLLDALIDGRPPPPLVRRFRAGAVPLSFGQERLYFLNRLQGDDDAYTIHRRMRLPGGVDAAALERAMGEVVRRHEVLRTTFHEVDGVAVQVAHPFTGFALPVVDLSALSPARRETEVQWRAADDAERPFDLAAGPLLRATLLLLGEGEHELLLGMHHIVTDGWSMEVLCRELSALYAAFAAGRPSPLPESALQYADYAVWQREQLRGPALHRELAWWKARLDGVPELLELPADRPHPAVRAHRGARACALLDADVLARLDALARQEGATRFMVLLAVFQALLSRYAGSDDVVVGTPVSGRTRRETEGLIGFFANTLVLRTDLRGDPPFRQAVRRVRGAVLGAFDHQELPFERLVAELRPERVPGRTPLFRVMFTVDDAEGGEDSALPGLAFHATGGATRRAKVELSLTCSPAGVGMETLMEYDTDLFDARTVERMLAHLGRFAAQVAADPERRLSAVELLTEAERARVLGVWNATERPYPDACIHTMIEARAARTPRGVALVHGDDRLTFAALNGAANRLAHALRGRGIGRGAFVPILAERGAHVAVAMLAVMKAGGAFVPLDAAWPAARLRGVLDGLGAPLLLAAGNLMEQAASLGRPVLEVALRGEGAPDPEVEVDADDPLYAIFTSGSTGAPRAAVATHGGIANRFHWMTEAVGADSAACVLQTTPHVYDSAVWQLFWPLAAGGRTVIPRAGRETDAAHLAELIHAEGVTMTDFVPSVFNVLVPELVADAGARDRLASLRTVVVGGEQITAATAHRFMACFPRVRVVNLYGPTECSIGSIHHFVHPSDGGRIPIGRPIANTRALVLDRAGRLAPVGVPGEILLGGRCVGPGYLGDAARTAAAFVPDPYAARSGERLYRTGDAGRYRADGSIECLGRLDAQVKIRGVRIEPGEIEAALRQHPGVRDALVLARDGAPGGPRLVAYVAADEPRGIHPSALREHLRARLPEAMIPAAFVALAGFPLTPGGKVDRRALPDAPAEAAPEHVAPRTPAEEILAGIWGEVLGVERVGVHDGFFDLGGHSLLATRVVSRVGRAFGIEVPLRTLFEHPTVAGLADHVQAAPASGGEASLHPLRRLPRDGHPPASFGQERLWRAHLAHPADTSFNLHYGLRVRGALNAAVLARALSEVVRRHEPLRTTLREDGGRVVQVIHPAVPLPLPEADLRGLPAPERAQALHALAAEQAARPFDLRRGPLLRTLLARMGEAEFALLLTLHHVVTDGWSTGVLMREISELCAAYAEGREPALGEPEVRYTDYAAWQRARLTGEALDRQLAYWRAQLAAAPRQLRLPIDRPRLPGARGWAATRRFALGDVLSHAVRLLARREGCTLYMALLAGFQAYLSRAAGQEDVCVGTPIAGRTRRELEGLVGFFTNTLVMRTDLSGAPCFRALLRRVRQTTLAAYAHQDLPFARLVAELCPGAGTEEMPLFQVVFELEHARGPRETLCLPDAELSPLERPPGLPRTLRSELRLTMHDDGAHIGGTLWYRTELFDARTIDRMIRGYRALLQAAVVDPDRPLAELPLSDDANGGAVTPDPGIRHPTESGLISFYEPSRQALRSRGVPTDS